MSIDLDAIYVNGVFRPLEPPVIPEGTRVHLRVEGEAGAKSAELINSMSGGVRAELDEFRRLMAELPIEGTADGFSGADHDRALYGR
jgi:predicted DNA-binding antitoxin AbrB/MazE fold protein